MAKKFYTVTEAANYLSVSRPVRPKVSLYLFSSLFTIGQNLSADHDMLVKWKNTTKGKLSESQQKRTTAHIRGGQSAEYWVEASESLLNNFTGRLVTRRLNKPKTWDCYSQENGLMQGCSIAKR